ncbi:MAG: energy transducer TonB [Lautropia sp.]
MAAAGGWLARRDPLAVGLVVSLALHLLVLLVRFSPPTELRFLPSESQLEVILLNAATEKAPLAPEVLAQVNMEGGGDRDEGRAKSPLPPSPKAEDGDELQRRMAERKRLEEEQQRLLALARAPSAYVEQRQVDTPEPKPKAPDAEDTKAMVARLEAQIARQIEDYNKRPRRLTFGVNAVGVNYARYVDAWAEKIERIGTERFPREARGRMYDSLVITVEIDKFGNVLDVLINQKSKYEALNRVIKQIVYAGAPYPAFSDEMRKEGDVLQIVRTWTFTNDRLRTESVGAK